MVERTRDKNERKGWGMELDVGQEHVESGKDGGIGHTRGLTHRSPTRRELEHDTAWSTITASPATEVSTVGLSVSDSSYSATERLNGTWESRSTTFVYICLQECASTAFESPMDLNVY